MFFILSKIFAFIINPFTWIVILLLFSFFTKNEKTKKKSLKWLLIITLFFSNAFIFDEFSRAWETPATPYESLKVYDYGIVLGGMSVHDESIDRVQFFRGADRLIQAIDLYKRGHIKKIIFSGGSGRILHPEMKEGMLVKPYMLKMGVNEEDLIVEGESQNTHENALFTKKIIDSQKLKGDFLLITSAFHMCRSIACFDNESITATAYSTDRFSGPRKFELDYLLIPNVSVLANWESLFHEWFGFVSYKLAGYL